MTGIIQAWYIGGVGSIILTVVQRNSICTCIVYCYQNEQENGEDNTRFTYIYGETRRKGD